MIPSWTFIQEAIENGIVPLEKVEGMIFAKRHHHFFPLKGPATRGFEDIAARCMSEFAAADSFIRDVMPDAVVSLSLNQTGWSAVIAMDPAARQVAISARSAPLAMMKASIEALSCAEQHPTDA